MRVFITGTAGFIGFHLARRLLAQGHMVDGYDGLTPYYDLRLKDARRNILLEHENYHDNIAMLEDMAALTDAAECASVVHSDHAVPLLHRLRPLGGRPDMAPLKFLDAIESGRPIDIYNHRDLSRDFTYVEDLVEAVARLIDCVPRRDAGDASVSPVASWRVVNIGGGAPVKLLDFIDTLERVVGKKAIRNYLDMQKGDVPRTFASADLLEKLTGFRPQTPIEVGLKALVEWNAITARKTEPCRCKGACRQFSGYGSNTELVCLLGRVWSYSPANPSRG
jgi:nucleoside-diphosphate-sugar epimerase